MDGTPHLRIEQTGAVVDLPDDLGRELVQALPAELLQRIEDRMHFRIRQIHLELAGDYTPSHIGTAPAEVTQTSA
ncbi:MAG: hypothetical protein HC898_10020 [Phycisphaerales bacterium]|nr:hypothetical protein [Phycisphaerales bacterium]